MDMHEIVTPRQVVNFPATSRFILCNRALIVGILLAIFLSLSFSVLSNSAFASEKEEAFTNLEKQYLVSKYYYNNLSGKPDFGNKRSNWEKGIRPFRKIYLARPKEALAPYCLYTMGRMYQVMYTRFRVTSDLDEAITYFKDVVSMFSKHRLADDALYLLGRIYLVNKKDSDQAAEYFAKIINLHPKGDMVARASSELKKMKYVVEVPVKSNPVKNAKSNYKTSILPIKHWSTDEYTRVVINATSPTQFRANLLEKVGNHPRRLYIDFSGSKIKKEDCSPIPIQDGLLKRVRAGQFSKDTVRVVLDIESISKYKIFSLQDPFRVIIDVKGESSNKQDVAASHDKNMKSDSSLSLAQQLGLGIRKIVIDPGHGGKDPGAISPTGLKEKHVVLKVSKMLAQKLRRELACEVVLTRTRDVFIPLEERTAIANMSKGDLFISVHANANPSPNVWGVETYFLNLTTNEDSMRVAARENATSASKMSDLQNILSSLMMKTKIKESAKLAQYVQTNMVNGLRLKDLGVKQAPFYVLIGAEMPAILSEVAFISNPSEAQKLRDERYLSAIATQIASGVTRYVKDSSLALLDY